MTENNSNQKIFNKDWQDFCKSVEPLKTKERTKAPLPKRAFAPSLTTKPYTFLSPEAPIDFSTTLDLHHLTFEQAYKALETFLKNAHLKGRKRVFIITGKGQVKEEGQTTLQQKVPKWLKHGPLSVFVARFEHAPLSKGGEGALEVTLIKKKH